METTKSVVTRLLFGTLQSPLFLSFLSASDEVVANGVDPLQSSMTSSNGGKEPLPPIKGSSEIGQPLAKEEDPLPRPKTGHQGNR